jgi:release factor glutamine methyltransferase
VTAPAAGLLFQLDRLDRQLLTLYALGRPLTDRAWLIASDLDTPAGVAALPADTLARLHALAERRLKGEPVAYLVGEKEFFGLAFEVNADVLVPRPETELLVSCGLQAVVALQAAWMLAERFSATVLDLGTGSGAVPVALAVQARQQGLNVRVFASDLSDAALAVARRNAQRHAVGVDFRQGAWFEPWVDADGQPMAFDVILSNPPYVVAGDPHLAGLRHEPTLALVGGGADGLGDVRTIVGQAARQLRPGGCLALEHGHNQGAAIARLLRDAGFTQVQTMEDTAGLGRITRGRWG